jgi:hypothetical protein
MNDAAPVIACRALAKTYTSGPQDVEVLQGVSTADRVVLNPPDSLATGDAVTVANDPPATARTAARAASARDGH